MQLFYQRPSGFTTNSSSSHSILRIPKGTDVHDKDVDEYFGWDFFTAASVEAKLRYLAATVFTTLRYKVGEDAAKAILKDYIGYDVGGDEHFGVDHQSILSLPADFRSPGDIPSKEFMRALVNYFSRDDIVIVGGNDNTEERHPLFEQDGVVEDQIGCPVDYYGVPWVCRNDGTHWTLFNQFSGAKLRLGLTADEVKPTKAMAPETVDLKITDMCKLQCDYCYQDSKPNGKHAPQEHVNSLLYALADMKVFEIAIGGGNPLEHPKFVQIMETARYLGIVPNFSTRGYTWLQDVDHALKILGLAGNVGFSVTNSYEIERIQADLDFLRKYREVNPLQRSC